MLRLPRGQTYTTLDIQVRYLRPLTRETGRVVCTGVVDVAHDLRDLTGAELFVDGGMAQV